MAGNEEIICIPQYADLHNSFSYHAFVDSSFTYMVSFSDSQIR